METDLEKNVTAGNQSSAEFLRNETLRQFPRVLVTRRCPAFYGRPARTRERESSFGQCYDGSFDSSLPRLHPRRARIPNRKRGFVSIVVDGRLPVR